MKRFNMLILAEWREGIRSAMMRQSANGDPAHSNWTTRIGLALCIFVFFTAAPANCGGIATTEDLPVVATNSNRVPGGQLQAGILEIKLELREARWYPEKDGGPSLIVQAFTEAGKAPQIPGPVIRVPQGTEIHASVRNLLAMKAILHGLNERPGDPNDVIEVLPGETREVRFKAGVAGTYFYFARTTGEEEPTPLESQLSGAFIVDAPGQSVDDRIFIIGLCLVKPDTPEESEFLTINGKSWPFTERLNYTVGETVRWRWINASLSDHAMHLHGFFYIVNSVGNWERDTIYDEAHRRRVVTEHLDVGSTMYASWVPDRSGNWLFHCHMILHMMPKARLGKDEPAPQGDSHDHSGMTSSAGMGGLVMGIHITPKAGMPPVASSAAPPLARKLQLFVRIRPATDSAIGGLSFDLREADTDKPGKLGVPGPPIVLTRGQPVEITVINQAQESTSVHWHGIELESYYDGVPGMTGNDRKITPPIAPGESFVARMTPPRAGTFIYHTHWHDLNQLTAGLYGALIVLEPGQKYDPELDKVFVISRGKITEEDRGPLLVNGKEQPRPMELKKGQTYRFRFINITTNESDTEISLRDAEHIVEWRLISKDGADAPPAQAIMRAARQLITVGETYDFEFQPQNTGVLRLEILSPNLLRWVIAPLDVVKK